MKICPLCGVRCRMEDCAWWSEDNETCAVVLLAENGGFCCQPHGEYAELLPDDETDMEDRG